MFPHYFFIKKIVRKFCTLLRLKTTKISNLFRKAREFGSTRFGSSSKVKTRLVRVRGLKARVRSSSRKRDSVPSLVPSVFLYIVKSEVLYQRPHMYHRPLRSDRQPAPHRACARGELDEQGAQVEDVPHQRPVQVADELGHPGPGGGRAQVHHKQGGGEQEGLK